MEYKPRQKYLNIKEAAVQYEVSRGKLHRMIRSGRLRTAKDLRDERATLLRAEELEALFGFPKEEDVNTWTTKTSEVSGMAQRTGQLNAEARIRIDALRMRVSGGRVLPGDSVDLVREARELRDAELSGDREDGAKRRRD